MCEFCRKWCDEDTICGSTIRIYTCCNPNSKLTGAQLLRNNANDSVGVVLYEGNVASGYFRIKYCPICGRKLVQE